MTVYTAPTWGVRWSQVEDRRPSHRVGPSKGVAVGTSISFTGYLVVQVAPDQYVGRYSIGSELSGDMPLSHASTFDVAQREQAEDVAHLFGGKVVEVTS